MIKHIVLWRLKEQAENRTKMENARRIQTQLQALNGKIPGLIKLEVGINFAMDECSADIVLYSEFESRAALENYHSHPDHVAIKPLVLACRSERRVADYETGSSQ